MQGEISACIRTVLGFFADNNLATVMYICVNMAKTSGFGMYANPLMPRSTILYQK
jgi:hypothetical protein